MTDNEITIKALKELLEVMLHDGDLQRVSTISHTIYFINRQKAEIERLKKAIEQCEDSGEYWESKYKTAKAEAIKECIQKIKVKSKKEHLVCSGAGLRTDYTITDKELDNILKEMVGDTE